jgi:hypothetical protein
LVVAAEFAAVDVLVVFAQQGERWTSTGESDSSHDVPLNSYIVWFTIPGAYTSGSSHRLISDDGLP